MSAIKDALKAEAKNLLSVAMLMLFFLLVYILVSLAITDDGTDFPIKGVVDPFESTKTQTNN